MIIFLLRRLFLLGTVLLGLSIFAFSLGYLFPGDPLQNFSGLRYIDSTMREQLIQQYRLDQSYSAQYLAFLGRVIQGDWGLSFASQQPLLKEVWMVLPATLELTAYALL